MTLVDRVLTILLVTTTGLLLHLPAAQAQSAEAEALFREGRTLIQQNKLAAGCDKLVSSERLESSVGTLLNLGDCHEKLGRHASAWAAFRKAEAMAKRSGDDAKRQGEARKRAVALEAKLSSIVIEVAPASRVDGLVIRRGGIVVDHGMWSSAVPVDPGTYQIVAEAPGRRTWRAEIKIAARSKRWVVVPKLEAAPVALAPEVTAPVPAITPAPRPAAPVVIRTSPRSMWTTTRKLSLVLAVAGAGAVGGGVYFGMRSQDLEEQSDARCPLTICADAEALRLNDDAQDAALRANALYIGGGVALAAAAVMWFVGAPDDETIVTPTVGRDRIGVSFAGRF